MVVKIILFDLGDTLEHNDALLPGAVETLTAVSQLHDSHQQPLGMGLVSDFDMPQTPADIPSIRQQYIAILENLQIRTFFEPLASGHTRPKCSPDSRVWAALTSLILRFLQSCDVITENKDHTKAVRRLECGASISAQTSPDSSI
jgi:hypothetical protein